MPRFEWRVAKHGYTWRADEDATDEFGVGPEVWLEPAIWEFRRYEPMGIPSLFRTFADVACTEEAILAFANEYGHLGAVFSEPDEPYEPPNEITTERQKREWEREFLFERSAFDPFTLWLTSIDKMKTCLCLWDACRSGMGEQDGTERLIGVVNGELDRDHVDLLIEPSTRTPSGFAISYAPRNLLGAMWVQLAQAMAENRDFRQCEACSRWFQLSPTEHRTSRRYCSEACRSRAYRERKVQAVRMADAGKSPEEIAEVFGTKLTTVRSWLAASRG